MKNISLFEEFRFWRVLINFWSLLFFIVVILDFCNDNIYSQALNVLSAVYIGALAVYVSHKEFERWYDKHESRHPGELFVIAWSVLVFGIIILDIVLSKSYELPGSVISSYIAVLTILAITKKSKAVYKKHRRKK